MKKRKLLVWLLKAPLSLLIIASFVVSIYAAITGLQGIRAGAPIVFGIILAMYFFGIWLERKRGF